MRKAYTINTFTLYEIAIILAGQKAVSISSYNSFNIPCVRLVLRNFIMKGKECYPYPPFTLKKRPSMVADEIEQKEPWGASRKMQ